MVKTIECGYLRADVDMTDINDPKIHISTAFPVEVGEYRPNYDVWRWDHEFAVDISALYAAVDAHIFAVRQEARRERLLCAVS